MQDGIIKKTGNSRYLKSAIPAGTTWEQALTMLQAGTFPIDLNGINAAGWQQLATALGKASLLKDATAALYGKDANAVPDDIFATIKSLLDTKAVKTSGSFTPTGSQRSISLGIDASVVIAAGYLGTRNGWFTSTVFVVTRQGCIGGNASATAGSQTENAAVYLKSISGADNNEKLAYISGNSLVLRSNGLNYWESGISGAAFVNWIAFA